MMRSQMNRIEKAWLHLKCHELSAQLFEDKYDLAIALMETIEERGQRRGYPVERFRFNSGSLLILQGWLDNFNFIRAG